MSPKSVQRKTISLETTATPVGIKLADIKFDSNHPPKVCPKTEIFSSREVFYILSARDGTFVIYVQLLLQLIILHIAIKNLISRQTFECNITIAHTRFILRKQFMLYEFLAEVTP